MFSGETYCLMKKTVKLLIEKSLSKQDALSGMQIKTLKN